MVWGQAERKTYPPFDCVKLKDTRTPPTQQIIRSSHIAVTDKNKSVAISGRVAYHLQIVYSWGEFELSGGQSIFLSIILSRGLE